MTKRLLIVDDEASIRNSLTSFFKTKGFEVGSVADGAEFLGLLKARRSQSFFPDVVLLDVHLPDMSGLDLIKDCKKSFPECQIIVITGFGNIAQSVEAMRQGASDYILKPFNLDEIQMRVQRVLDMGQLKEQVNYLSEKLSTNYQVAQVQGPNSSMAKVYREIDLIAASPASTVLIWGETGTGKEMIAHRIHALSGRATMPFIEVNATALSSELLESELFGHEEGSFTGATKAKKGLFELANKGTLFLDEIGDMDLAMQAKILRALQEKRIRRVGGTSHINVDIRLITATNRNLAEAVAKGEFREDLYYRLNVIPIHLPPLRDRADDIPALVLHFVKTFNREFGRHIQEVSPDAMRLLQQYPWPGNVRELRNLLERSILLETENTVLKPEHLKFGQETHLEARASAESSGVLLPSERIGQNIPLDVIERQHIEGVLLAQQGNKNQAAQVLGIDRTTLYNKLKKYQISH